MSADERLVDARGLLCPWPVLRLSRAAREIGGQGRIRLLADDLAAAAEIESLCVERGWKLTPDPADPGAYGIVIR